MVANGQKGPCLIGTAMDNAPVCESENVPYACDWPSVSCLPTMAVKRENLLQLVYKGPILESI